MLKFVMSFVVSCASVFVVASASASFLPDQVQVFEDDLVSQNAGMTEQEFNQILNEIREAYAPIAKTHRIRLSVVGEWNSKQLNAVAGRTLDHWQVKISGALARHPNMTGDSVALVVCHELGHHFGGFPYIPPRIPFIGTWSSTEGQSDYYASHVCTRRIWGDDKQVNASFRPRATTKMVAMCADVWKSEDDQNLCLRVLAATQAMTDTMAAILRSHNPSANIATPDFGTPSAEQVTQTNYGHPRIQCRMDTSVQGALCAAPFNDELIPGFRVRGAINNINAEKEAAMHSCTQLSGYTTGLRPRCWFMPRL